MQRQTTKSGRNAQCAKWNLTKKDVRASEKASEKERREEKTEYKEK